MTTVRTQSVEVMAMQEDWTLIDALMGGTKAMRRAGRRYLPQWPGELKASYDTRLATATLFPAYSRTVSVLTGKPFSKAIAVGEDVPPRIVEWLNNVDLQNRNLDVFAAEVCQAGLAYGLTGILVDYPVASYRTVADEKAANARPYLLHIKPGNILGWKSEQSNGGNKLTQLRLLEFVKVDDGPFGTKTVEQVRVLEPGQWEVYRRETNGDAWLLFDQGTTSLQEIPFVPVYGFRRDLMIGAPPMLELAYANVEHWQSASDQQTILHFARVPILFASGGASDMSLVIGGGSLNTATSPDAKLIYVEHSGKAIDAGRTSILDLEDRMRQAGAELLIIKPGNITEVATISDNEKSMCDLQRIMQAVEDSVDQALDLMAKWVGEKAGGHISVYRDFGAATLAEASANLLFEMKSVGSLSFETLLNELKRRGIISPDVDIAHEITRAKAEAPAAVATQEIVRP